MQLKNSEKNKKKKKNNRIESNSHEHEVEFLLRFCLLYWISNIKYLRELRCVRVYVCEQKAPVSFNWKAFGTFRQNSFFFDSHHVCGRRSGIKRRLENNTFKSQRYRGAGWKQQKYNKTGTGLNEWMKGKSQRNTWKFLKQTLMLIVIACYPYVSWFMEAIQRQRIWGGRNRAKRNRMRGCWKCAPTYRSGVVMECDKNDCRMNTYISCALQFRVPGKRPLCAMFFVFFFWYGGD